MLVAFKPLNEQNLWSRELVDDLLPKGAVCEMLHLPTLHQRDRNIKKTINDQLNPLLE